MNLFKTKPYQHQIDALARSQDRPDYALLMEAGTGKTKIIIDNAAYLYSLGRIDSLIVIAPNGVHRNWIGEIEAHLHDDVPRVTAYYEAGVTALAPLRRWCAACKETSALRVLTFNIEVLQDAKRTDAILGLMYARQTMLVIDESQRIKAPGSKRTKSAYRVGHAAKYRRILTGTPVSQGLQDLYSQFRFLDWKIIGNKTYADFKGEYCVMGGHDGMEIVAYRNTERLRNRLAPYAFEVNKKDCLDLPPQTWIKREVEMSAEQKKHYKALKDQFVTELKGTTLEAPLAAVRMIRLRQILSGFFPLPENDKKWEALPCPRLETCADLVEEASRGKVIVWCHFHADVERVIPKLKERGIAALPYYGGISDNRRAENLAQWRADPSITALVATEATGGVGLTLNEADTAVFFSHDYNYEHRIQAEARNHRAGQTKPITYYILVARGTADVRMLRRVEEKGSVADLIKNLDRKNLIALFEEAA